MDIQEFRRAHVEEILRFMRLSKDTVMASLNGETTITVPVQDLMDLINYTRKVEIDYLGDTTWEITEA